MKNSRFPALLMAAVVSLFLASCIGSSKRLTLNYSPEAGGAGLNPGNVFLVVSDQRPSKSIVGPGAQEKNLFRGSRDGQVDLSVALPTGQKVNRSQLSVTETVFEAVRERLRLLGVTANPNNINAKARVTINIVDFVLDAEGTNAKAHVRLEGVIEGPDMLRTNRIWAEADSSNFKLIGDMGGDKSLGEALTLAVNRLNFSSLNNY